MGSHAEDALLVERALAGQDEAYGELIDRYHRMVKALLLEKTGSMQDAEDLTQEAFLRAYRALPKLNDPTCFASWLYRLTHHLALDWLRARSRKGGLSLQALEEQHLHLFKEDGREQLRRRANQELVRRALGRLPHRYQVVLTLRYLEELSYREIAARLQEPEGTIANRIHRALQLLRGKLGVLREPRSETTGRTRETRGGGGR